MTTREKLIELMKDPNSVQLALDLAKHQDIELYDVAHWTFTVFSSVTNSHTGGIENIIDSLRNEVFSDIMKGRFHFKYPLNKIFLNGFRQFKGPAQEILGVKLCLRSTSTNTQLLRANYKPQF